LFGRVLNFGDLEFKGAGVSRVRLHGVSDVLMVKEIVEDTIQRSVDRAQLPAQKSYPVPQPSAPAQTPGKQVPPTYQYKFCQFCN